MQNLINRLWLSATVVALSACGGGSGGGHPSSAVVPVTPSSVTIQAADLAQDRTDFTVVDSLATTQLSTARTNDLATNGPLVVTMEEDLRGAPNSASGLSFRLRVIDAVNFTEVGHLDKAWAVVRMKFGVDGYLYLDTSGQGLIRVDLSDPANPRVVEKVETFWGGLESFIQGDVLFQAAYEHGLLVFDITDKQAPQSLDSIAFEATSQLQTINKNRRDQGLVEIKTQARALDAAGSTVFIATRDGGLFLVNAANPSQLAVVGHYFSQTAWDVAVGGDTAYLITTQGLEILDVSDAADPQRRALVLLPGHAGRVTINQNIMVVAIDLTATPATIEQNGQPVTKAGALVYHELGTPLTSDNFKLIYFDDAVAEARYQDGALYAVTQSAVFKLSP